MFFVARNRWNQAGNDRTPADLMAMTLAPARRSPISRRDLALRSAVVLDGAIASCWAVRAMRDSSEFGNVTRSCVIHSITYRND
ncbi:hypothetical protein [Lentzea sp.]|uniref:hypothetical protein n=1 Tax=Lentzea sp. TaxID=56099 RepID=UPI002BD82977|nr:hypothetical protein [Lentzea sp.]HUQ60617.1 hypothetical protein [Lentzea sp.]